MENRLLTGYAEFLADLKEHIRRARIKAALSANRELILLYWEIGRMILERQRKEGWGSKVIDRLAQDLRREFPDLKGFSARNLKYMRAFAEAYLDKEFVQQVVAQIYEKNIWYDTSSPNSFPAKSASKMRKSL